MAEAHTAQSHSQSTRFYWMVAAVLAAITFVEVVLTLIPGIPHLLLVVLLLALAAIKGAGVVMFFMHLRGDARVFQLLFIAPLVLATSMIVAFLAIFSHYVGIGG
jgi:cytochrome c oxidase subunit 4/cytochrome o ubiquinol oxidase operon protein cyoD